METAITSIRHTDLPASHPLKVRRKPRRPLIISEELFKGVLVKERKRVDRLNRPLVLLIVTVRDPRIEPSPSTWVPAIEALAAVTRDTDYLGWFEWRRAIGVILPEVCVIDAAKASELEARARRELAKRSDALTANRFVIRLHVHPPEPTRMEAGQAEPYPFPQ